MAEKPSYRQEGEGQGEKWQQADHIVDSGSPKGYEKMEFLQAHSYIQRLAISGGRQETARHGDED